MIINCLTECQLIFKNFTIKLVISFCFNFFLFSFKVTHPFKIPVLDGTRYISEFLSTQVCARFTQAEMRHNRIFYATALPLAAILPPNVTSSADTSVDVVMVTVNMAACSGNHVRVVVEAYRRHPHFRSQLR